MQQKAGLADWLATCFCQAHLEADGGVACARSLARLVREAPLAADLAPYYERHIGVLRASLASLPAGCAGLANAIVNSVLTFCAYKSYILKTLGCKDLPPARRH